MNGMTVTENFLEDNRTPRGGFTRKQFEALGFRWPVARGWKRRIIGKTISNAQADAFIAGSGTFSDRTEKKQRKRERREGRIEGLQREMAQLRKEMGELHERLAEIENRVI